MRNLSDAGLPAATAEGAAACLTAIHGAAAILATSDLCADERVWWGNLIARRARDLDVLLRTRPRDVAGR